MVKTDLEQRIIDALEQEAPAHGIDVCDVEVVGATKAPCVRVRLDRADGEAISLEDVTAQNAWVNACIEELDPVKGAYMLEVSSPGMARPLRRPRDFQRFLGEDVELTTAATDGRRKYRGTLVAADDATATLDLKDDTSVQLSYDEIKKCNLKPTYDFKSGKAGK